MSLDLNRSGWDRVHFGDVVRNVNHSVRNPEREGIDRVIAMEHLDPGELAIHRWGSLDDGTSFTRRVKPGQTLFGKRRAYQRKAAFAGFGAICSGDILTLEPDDSKLLAEFLPFLVQSDAFFDHALGTSAGSLSPRTSWRDLAKFEFDLPPLDEQRRIAKLLWALEGHQKALAERNRSLAVVRKQLLTFEDIMRRSAEAWIEVPFPEAVDFREGPGIMARDFHESGVPLIRLAGLAPGAHLLDGCNHLDARKVDQRWSHFRVEEGDVLLSTSATLGRVAVVDSGSIGAIPYTGIIRMRPADARLHPQFLPWVLRSTHFARQVRDAGVGSVMAHFGPSHLRKMTVLLPPIADQERLVAQFARFENVEHAGIKEHGSVLKLRSSLLADFFGGR